MHIVSLTYKVSLEIIDQYLDSHIKFLDEQYELGNFLASGRKVPRTGGFFLSAIVDKTKLKIIIEKDPFKINDLADYEIIEFIPTRVCKELKFLVE